MKSNIVAHYICAKWPNNLFWHLAHCFTFDAILSGTQNSELRNNLFGNKHQGQMNIQEVMHITLFISCNKYSSFWGPTQRKKLCHISIGNSTAEMRQSYDHPTPTMGPQTGKTTASHWIGALDLTTHRIIYDVSRGPIKATGCCHGTHK